MKKTKKLLVILLTLSMVLGLMPVSAFAEGAGTATGDQVTVTIDPNGGSYVYECDEEGNEYDVTHLTFDKGEELQVADLFWQADPPHNKIVKSITIYGQTYNYNDDNDWGALVEFTENTTLKFEWQDAVTLDFVTSDGSVLVDYGDNPFDSYTYAKGQKYSLYELATVGLPSNGKALDSITFDNRTYDYPSEDMYEENIVLDKDMTVTYNLADSVTISYKSVNNEVDVITPMTVVKGKEYSLDYVLDVSSSNRTLESVTIGDTTYDLENGNYDKMVKFDADTEILLNWIEEVYIKYNIGEGGSSDGYYDEDLGPGCWVAKGKPVGAEEFQFDVIADEGKVLDKIIFNGKVIYSEWDDEDLPAVVFDQNSEVDITFADGVKVNVDANGKEAIGWDGEPLEYFYAIKGRPISVFLLDRIEYPEGYFGTLVINGVEYPDDMEKVTLTEDTTVKYLWEREYNVFIDLNGATYTDEWQDSAEYPWQFSQDTYCIDDFYLPDTLTAPEGKELVAIEIDGKRYYNLDTEFKLDKDINVKYIWETVKIDTKKPVVENKASEEAIVKGDVVKNVPADKPLAVEVKTGKVEYNKEAVKVIKDKVNDDDKVVVRLEKTDVSKAGNKKQQAVIKSNKGLEVFEITLEVLRKDGTKKYEIKDFKGGKATITVDFPNPENKELQVYRVEENGTLTPMETTYKDGKLTWVTDGHSYYMVADKTTVDKAVVNTSESDKPEVKPEADKDTAPKTGDGAEMGMWVLLIMTAAAAALVVKKESER